MTPNPTVTATASSGRPHGTPSYQLGPLSSSAMAPGTRDDITATIDTGTDAPADHDGAPPWHERLVVLVAGAVVGAIGLIALAVSVIAMSDQSSHPTHGQATPTAVSSTAAPTAPSTPAPAPTVSTAMASPAEPLPTAPPTTSAPHFAAGPTAEMKVRPSPIEPGPFRLPRWLERMLHPKDGPN